MDTPRRILLLLSLLSAIALSACCAGDATFGSHDLVPKPTRIIADEETGTFEVETDGEVEVSKLPDSLAVFTKVDGQLTEGIILRPGTSLHARCFIEKSRPELLRAVLPAAVIWSESSDPRVSHTYQGPWAPALLRVSVLDKVLQEPLECRAVLVRPGGTVQLRGLGAVMPSSIMAD